MIGIKVSKPSFDVKTETDIKNMIFSSEKNVFGHRLTETRTVTTNASGIGNTSFSHNFGYIPIVLVFVDNYTSTRLIVPTQIKTIWSMSEILDEVFHFDITSTQITLKVYAHHYEPVMGGSDTPLVSQDYTFTVVYFYNEMSETV